MRARMGSLRRRTKNRACVHGARRFIGIGPEELAKKKNARMGLGAAGAGERGNRVDGTGDAAIDRIPEPDDILRLGQRFRTGLMERLFSAIWD